MRLSLPKIRIGGDVGKALGAVTAPVRNAAKAVESLAKGDVQGAVGNTVYALAGANPLVVASNASSTVNSALRTDAAKVLTIGMAGDAAELGEKANKASYGGKIGASDWSLMGRMAGRAAVVAGAVVAAPVVASSVAGASAPSATTIGNTLAAAGLVQKAATNPNAALAGLAENFVPGSGDVVSGLLPGNQTRQPAMTSGSSTTTPIIQNSTKNNTATYIMIGSALLLVVAVAYKFRGK